MRYRSILDMKGMSEYRVLFLLSYPIILSYIVQGLYNLVDSIFLSKLGEEVLSAVSLAFVFQSFCTAFFTGIATGINAVVSKSIGAGEITKAKESVLSGIFVQVCMSLIIAVIGVFGVVGYFEVSTTNSSVIKYGVEYLRPLLIFSFFSCFQITMERLLQSSGLSRYMLYSQLIGTVVNCILDPIFIFGMFGFPELGVAGASWATLIGQGAAAGLSLYFNLKKNKLLFDRILIEAKIKLKSIGHICYIGLPTSSVGIAGAIGNYYINIILVDYLATANAAFGVYTKLQNLALMPTQGFGAGLVTQIAFFYGQRDMTRIKKSLIAGIGMIQTWGMICFCLFVFIPDVLMLPFNPTQQMLDIGRPCFRIIGTTYLVSGAMMAINSFFQAIGKSFFSLAISCARQILVRIPIASYLSRFGDIDLIWWCWPISEIISDIISLAFFIVAYKRLRQEVRRFNE